jgi:hypothetical protein
MAQYDLLLTQNVHASGVEFTERYVNMAKGSLLTADTNKVPLIIPIGTNGQILMADSTVAAGLKWENLGAGHDQNTDIGTTNQTFQLQTGSNGVKLKNNANVFEARNAADNAYADATFNKVTVGSAAPTGAYELVHKTYVDGLLSASDAMIFKGTIGTGGTYTIAAFNALASYNSGWTYRVIEAGTIKGKVCEIGDLLMAVVTRTGSGNVDADWTVAQTNIDGAVTGPASATDGHVALFDGISGKVIKSGGALGTMAFATATDYVAKSLFGAQTILHATTSATPAALTIAEQRIVGRKTAGNIAALTGTEVMNIIWVTAPATKTSAGTAGAMAKDDNFIYVCTATNVWKRSPIATNW